MDGWVGPQNAIHSSFRWEETHNRRCHEAPKLKLVKWDFRLRLTLFPITQPNTFPPDSTCKSYGRAWRPHMNIFSVKELREGKKRFFRVYFISRATFMLNIHSFIFLRELRREKWKFLLAGRLLAGVFYVMAKLARWEPRNHKTFPWRKAENSQLNRILHHRIYDIFVKFSFMENNG